MERETETVHERNCIDRKCVNLMEVMVMREMIPTVNEETKMTNVFDDRPGTTMTIMTTVIDVTATGMRGTNRRGVIDGGRTMIPEVRVRPAPHPVSCDSVPCHAMPCRAVLCMPCRATRCRVIPYLPWILKRVTDILSWNMLERR